MNDEYLRSFVAQQLIDEIGKTDTANVADMSDEDHQMATDDVRLEVSELAARSRHLREQYAGRHPGETSEDARRRLQSAMMNTNCPKDRARALILKRIKLRQQVALDEQKLGLSRMKLEAVNAELEATGEVLAALEKAREFHRTTGLYEATGAFIARLYDEWGVGWTDVDLLNTEQYRRLVAIIREPSSAAIEQS